METHPDIPLESGGMTPKACSSCHGCTAQGFATQVIPDGRVIWSVGNAEARRMALVAGGVGQVFWYSLLLPLAVFMLLTGFIHLLGGSDLQVGIVGLVGLMVAIAACRRINAWPLPAQQGLESATSSLETME